VEAATAVGTDADDQDIDGAEAEGLERASGGTSGDDVRVSLQAAHDASAAGPVAKYEYASDGLPLALGLRGGPQVSTSFGIHARRSTSFRFDAVRTADRRRSDERGLARNSCTPRARAIGAARSHRVTTTTRLGVCRWERLEQRDAVDVGKEELEHEDVESTLLEEREPLDRLRSADRGGEASKRTVGRACL
jgi:hypothetical protein